MHTRHPSFLKIFCIGLFAASGTLLGCSGSEMTPVTPMPSDARVLATVSYVPGPAWDEAKPAEEQALGPHLEFVAAEHAAGRLVANGLLTTAPRGLYLLEGSAAAQAFIAADPGLESKVLVHEQTEDWALAIDRLGGEITAGEVAFVLRYRPGRSWEAGKPLAEQAIASHLSFIEGEVGAGVVVGGGPVDGGTSGGMYVIRVADKTAADAFVARDPGVLGGIFAPQVDGWQLMSVPPQ